MENEALRGKLGLAKNVRGLMVREPKRRDPSYPLKEFDILTRIGTHEIDNEGMIQVQDNLRLSFMSQVPKLAQNGTVPVSVLRAGKTIEVALPVCREPDHLLRGYDGRYPSYFVCGPLVFSPVVSSAISYYFQYNPALAGRNSPIAIRRADRARFPGEELVVVTAPLLRTRMTKGYADPFGQVVSEVNGTKVKNLAHLVELIRSMQGRIPHVPLRRGLRRDPGLSPQGDARSDRAAHERERHSPPRKRRRAGGLERQGRENQLS